MIFTVAWALMVSGVVAFSMIKEPADMEVRPRSRLKTYLFELFLIVKRDHNYRRYLVTMALRACEGLAMPFYIVYARFNLGMPEAAAGIFLIAGIISTVPAAIFWGKLADRFGNRIVIILSCLASLAAPLLALAIVALESWGAFDGEVFRFGLFGAQASVSVQSALVWVVAPIFILVRVAAVGCAAIVARGLSESRSGLPRG